MNCRHCEAKLSIKFLDLGNSPPSNAFLPSTSLHDREIWYPLRVLVCNSCWLVQTEDYLKPTDIFVPEYAYFSSISSVFLNHAKNYVQSMISRFSLNGESLVAEVAANDGYLLQYLQNNGIPCYGIEPTETAASLAEDRGLEIIRDFFTAKLATTFTEEGRLVDLAVANNVLAHVPDINDFIKGFNIILKPRGVATFENPHLLNLIKYKQFDTIYHEHFSYLSLTALKEIFKSNGLTIFDVEELPIHGGSLRYFAQKSETGVYPVSDKVDHIIEKEKLANIHKAKTYESFQRKVALVQKEFTEFLYLQKSTGKLVAGYGAAAKANTLINSCGLREDSISFIVDKNSTKQGMFCPGSKIPIVQEQVFLEKKPDYIIIFPWNIKSEIENQLSYVREWGCQFVTAIPELEIF